MASRSSLHGWHLAERSEPPKRSKSVACGSRCAPGGVRQMRRVWCVDARSRPLHPARITRDSALPYI